MAAEAQSVHEAFADTAARSPYAPFVSVPSRPGRAWLPDGAEYSYGEVAARVEELSRRYARAGYGCGHRVALLLENRPQFFDHYLALNALGVGIVPINPDYRHDEMAYQMSHSRADLAIAVTERVADLRSVAAKRSKPLPVLDANDLPTTFPSPVARAGDWSLGIEAECALMYTSGTTGRPKACILTNRYYLEAGRWYRDLGGLAAIRAGPRSRLQSTAALPHERAGGDRHHGHADGQLHDRAGTLFAVALVGRDRRDAGDRDPLSGRGAAVAARPAAVARRAQITPSGSDWVPASSRNCTPPSRRASDFRWSRSGA